MKRRNDIRQRVIDALHEQPGMTPHECHAIVGCIEVENLSKLMCKMADAGELKRERDESIHGKPYRYTALVDKPRREQAAQEREARVVAGEKKAEKPHWIKTNRCDDSRKPYPRQGGQGAVGGFFRHSMMLGEP